MNQQQNRTIRKLRMIICVATLGLGLTATTACRNERMVTLEEAKQIAATFEGTSFTPPPKTVNDITAILDQEKLTDPRAEAEARAIVAMQPPADVSSSVLADFFQKRGKAARQIGDVRRELNDLKEAERLSRETGQSRAQILWDLSRAEIFAGNFADSIRHRQEAYENIPERSRGRRIIYGAILASMSAAMGDLKAADQQFAAAEDLYAKSVDWKSTGQYRDGWTLQLRRAEAKILYFKGRYFEAEKPIRLAIEASRKIVEREAPRPRDFRSVELVYVDLARVLKGQGRFIEAEIAIRYSLTGSLRRLGRNSSNTAYTLRHLAVLVGAQGRYDEAEKLARAVIDIYRRIGAPEDSFMLAKAQKNLAGFLVNQDLWEEALAQFEGIRQALRADPGTYHQHFAGDLNWALALIGAERANEARGVAENAVERNLRMVGKKHYNTAVSKGVLAMAFAKLGMRGEALVAFSQAIPILLSRSRESDSEETNQAARGKRVGLILESYIDLLSAIRGTKIEQDAGLDAAAEAFRIADVGRSRLVQQALGASAARAATKSPALADLVRREQDASKQIGSLYGLLVNMVSGPTDQQDSQAISALRISIDDLRTARGALSKEIEKEFPEYAQLINPKPATIEKVQANLSAGESLISTYVGLERSYVWAVPRQGEASFVVVELGEKRIAGVVKELRSALDPQAASLGDIPSFNVQLANRLYRSILAPVKAGWKDASSLLIVAHKALGQLPFSVLVTKRTRLPGESGALFSNYRKIPFLARTHSVTSLPSVTSLASLRALPAANPARRPFAGFGDPYFSVEQAANASKPQPVQVAALQSRGAFNVRGLPLSLRSAPKTAKLDSAELAQLPRLPDTFSEVRSIAKAVNANLNRDVFTGHRATEERVKIADLSKYKVLAFATHGLVPGDLDGLNQPALALSNPKLGKITEDGLLTMGEILSLRLDADWVVLSACNTASGNGAGAEAFSGLGRAFFYAGTRALLLSNWPVETTSAKALTTDLFKRQSENPNLTRAQALRQAMLGLIDGNGFVDTKSGKIVFSYAHPIFWAPFSLVGDGGGGKPAI